MEGSWACRGTILPTGPGLLPGVLKTFLHGPPLGTTPALPPETPCSFLLRPCLRQAVEPPRVLPEKGSREDAIPTAYVRKRLASPHTAWRTTGHTLHEIVFPESLKLCSELVQPGDRCREASVALCPALSLARHLGTLRPTAETHTRRVSVGALFTPHGPFLGTWWARGLETRPSVLLLPLVIPSPLFLFRGYWNNLGILILSFLFPISLYSLRGFLNVIF